MCKLEPCDSHPKILFYRRFCRRICCAFSCAKPKRKSAAIDELQKKLFKNNKNPNAKRLKAAADALRANRFDAAKAAAAAVSQDPTFGDLGLWIQANAERRAADAALEKKQWEPARTASERAIDRLTPINKTIRTRHLKKLGARYR